MRKTILNLLMPLAIVVTLGSCNKDDENLNAGESQITLKGTAQQTSGGNANSRVSVGAFNVTHFQVGVQNFDMYYAASTDIRAGVDISNITLKSTANANAGISTSASQPKTNILVQDGNYLTTTIGDGLTPNGNYKEVTFSLFKNNSAAADSFARGKSLYIVGNVNGKTVRIWMTAEESLRAQAAPTNGYEVNSKSDFFLRFNLNTLFANMNIATALDSNADGIIDIGPNNVDGNAILHTRIRSNLNSAVEFGK